MTAVIVCGMHRSGTSLVASMLQAMGVNMGARLMGPGEHNPKGHFEDMDFVELNEEILSEAGGNWANPPSQEAIEEAGQRLKYSIGAVVDRKDWQRLWGWKDPRTCLTAGLWHRHLDDARYVVVRRDRPAVVASLLARDGGNAGGWDALCGEYERRLVEFLTGIEAPIHFVRYEDITHPKTGAKEAAKLAAFVGLDRYAAARAVDRIEYRDSWGFGTVGFGVPKFKECDHFWLAWSWFLLNGVEEDDRFLNRSGRERRMPLITWMPRMHNAIIRMFLESGCDTLCLIEDDHYFPADQLHKMRHKLENQGFDIVCASYVKRTRTDIPLPMGWDIKQDSDKPWWVQFRLDEIEYEGTQEYDGAAFGFTLIRRWVLEAMLGDEDPSRYEWAECIGEITPDLPFYFKAVGLGARTGVDRDNWIGHMGWYNHTPEDFRWWNDMRIEYKTEHVEVTNG